MQSHLNPLEDAIKDKLSSLGDVFVSAAENEANEPARSACEHAVDCFVNGLGTGREATQTESD